jgi:hypothetical protein
MHKIMRIYVNDDIEIILFGTILKYGPNDGYLSRIASINIVLLFTPFFISNSDFIYKHKVNENNKVSNKIFTKGFNKKR